MSAVAPARDVAGESTETQATSVHLVDRVRAAGLQLPLLVGGAVLLISSIFFIYWHITLNAPQYPQGLGIDVYVNRMEDERNVREVDGLNHYIGMIKLTDAAKLERAVSSYAMVIVAVMAVGSIFLRGWWRTIVRIPLVAFPLVFAVDLFAWLYYAGNNLDDSAALSSSISEFTPRIVGEGTIGQFSTHANFEVGFWMSVVASILVLGAIVIDRRRENRETVEA